MDKIAILVCGVHRSGTSAMSGVINILDAYMGENMLQPHISNERGFYENKDVVTLNDYILTKLSSSWYDTEELVIDYENKELLELIKYVLMITFGDDTIISIKDPRMCLLFPLYQSVLNKLGYEVYYIRTHRPHDEIVKSLIKREGGLEEEWFNLISKYNKHLDGLPIETMNINYLDLLENIDGVIVRLQEYLPFLNYSEENITKIKIFIDKSLKHH